MRVYGKNVFKELQNNRNQIRKVYLSKQIKDEEIWNFIKQEKISFDVVDNAQLDRMVKAHHQGIVVDILDYQYYSLEDAFEDDMIVALDHLEDPHNLGAIIRTCEAAGIHSIIIPKDRSVLVNETVMKTSCGALNYVKVIMVSNLVTALGRLKKENYFVYAADMDGEVYSNVSYASKKVLVIGSEGRGVSSLVRREADQIISIPMVGQVNSLNASVAAAILIYGIKG